MIYKDLHSGIQYIRAIDPVVITDNTASVSAIVDMQGRDGLEFIIALGTLSDSDCTLTALVEDGDESDLSDNASVADAQLIGTEATASATFADDQEVHAIGYKGDKRYVRLTLTPAGNSGNIPLSAVAAVSSLAPPVTQNA